MATVYYTASSLDGYIVDEADSLDWLTSREIDPDGPFGYDAFIKSVGALVMGSSTYEWLVRNEPGAWMLRSAVVGADSPTRTSSSRGTRCRRSTAMCAELHSKLVAEAAGKDVWVVGGGDVAAQFVAAGLIDEMIVAYTPCSLGGGSRVLPIRSEWTLVEVRGQWRFRVCAVAKGLAFGRRVGRP